MGKITFILGGARSGKSQYALNLAGNTKKTLFIATAKAQDKEMQLRIKLHRKNRPSHWKTIEKTTDLSGLIKKISKKFDLAIIDCLTLFISNLLLEKYKDMDIEKEIDLILRMLKRAEFESILISNEVGLGIVPDNPLARRFRDLAGKINQLVTHAADEAYFMVGGLPIKLKGRFSASSP